jgi:dynactin 1
MPHLSDVRSSKTPFHLATVLSFVKKIAASTVAKDMKPGISPWEAVGNSIAQLAQECGKLLPLVMEGENVVKGKSYSNHT